MLFQEALYARASAGAELVAIVGEEISFVERPRAVPAVTFQVISRVNSETMEGLDGFVEVRVQADSWSTDYVEAARLGEILIALLTPPATVAGWVFEAASVEGPRDLQEKVDGIGLVHRSNTDFIMRAWPAT
ncbi:MAG: DUF3168 domain-containing protein [Allosphingosinicella sp.]